eukprot:8264598-Karenia_brevis.AAC.1
MTSVYNWLKQVKAHSNEYIPRSQKVRSKLIKQATTTVAEKRKQANIEVIITLAEVASTPRDIDYGRFGHIYRFEPWSSVSLTPERVSRPGSQKQWQPSAFTKELNNTYRRFGDLPYPDLANYARMVREPFVKQYLENPEAYHE